jgi:hypothetical protein
MRDALLILLTFALGLAIGRWWPLAEPPRATPHVPERATLHPVAPAASSAQPTWTVASSTPPAAAAPPPGLPPPPLPPIGTPLSEALPALIARAEAGDVQAATRWFREATICQLAGQETLDPPPMPPRDLPSAANHCLRQYHCTALPKVLHRLMALRLAAVHGNDDAAVAYAASPLWIWMHDPAIQSIAARWPVEAPELLARARERGHALAWLVTAEALTTGVESPDLRRALPADPRGGLAMLWALQQVPQPGTVLEQAYAGSNWVGLATRLGIAESEHAAIQFEGQRIYRRYLVSLTDLSAEIAASHRLIAPYRGGFRALLAELSPRCHSEFSTDPVLRALPEPNPHWG